MWPQPSDAGTLALGIPETFEGFSRGREENETPSSLPGRAHALVQSPAAAWDAQRGVATPPLSELHFADTQPCPVSPTSFLSGPWGPLSGLNAGAASPFQGRFLGLPPCGARLWKARGRASRTVAGGRLGQSRGAGRRTSAWEGLTRLPGATAPYLPGATSIGCRPSCRPPSTCCCWRASALGKQMTGGQRRAGLFKRRPPARPPELGSARRLHY